MKLGIVLGTRPEIIKLAPIIKECVLRNLDFFILHSNQHYSDNMDGIFFEELGLPLPKYNLNVGSNTHAVMTAKIMEGVERVLSAENPNWIIVQGDTNTVMAAALTASKMGIKIGHVEAGLRSYDRRMPEEINRIITDHISDMLYAPTNKQREILLSEGISDKNIIVTGNTIVDSIMNSVGPISGKHGGDYFLLTLHRPANVDSKKILAEILKSVEYIAREFNRKIIFPVHPRTEINIRSFNIKLPENIFNVINPVGYSEMLKLITGSELVLTDSGGLQEEACVLRVPCITLRDSTERPETVEVGANILFYNFKDRKIFKDNVNTLLERKSAWHNPFGDGKASEKIVSNLLTN